MNDLNEFMKYRSRTEIISAMLRSINSGATKTKIMYDAYLSFTQLREYLAHLQENDLVDFDKKTNTFHVTHKGSKFLVAFDEITALVSSSNGVESKKFII